MTVDAHALVRRRRSMRALLPGLVAAALLQSPSADAQDRGLQATVGVSAQRDNNFYRLPGDISPRAAGFDSDDRAGTVLSPFVDLNATAVLGRQQLKGQAGFSAYRYPGNQQYNTSTNSYRLAWLWQATSEFNGEISAGRQQSLSDFADTQSTQQNRVSLDSYRARVDYTPIPDLRSSLIGTIDRSSNSLGERSANAYDIRTARLELAGRSPLGKDIVFGAFATTGKYPNQQVLVLQDRRLLRVDNSYRQHGVDLSNLIPLAATVALDLRLGYSWRKYTEATSRDFKGPNGLAALSWQPTGRSTLRAALSRDINAVADFDRIFSRTTVRTLDAGYELTSKLRASASFSRSNVDYLGDPSNPLTSTDPREDTITQRRYGLSYVPQLRWTIDLSYLSLARSSNRNFAYTDSVTQLSTRYVFTGP